jgi:hypothetical protein
MFVRAPGPVGWRDETCTHVSRVPQAQSPETGGAVVPPWVITLRLSTVGRCAESARTSGTQYSVPGCWLLADRAISRMPWWLAG